MGEDASSLIDTKKLSAEEKRGYYAAWKGSGLSKAAFCKMHCLEKETFYYWHKRFRGDESVASGFSELTVKVNSKRYNQPLIQVGLKLPNQVQLQMTLQESQLISFIQGLCDATSIVR